VNGPSSHSDERPEGLDDRRLGDLAAFADGSLTGRRRAEIEAMVEASDALRSAVARQRTAAAALRGLDLPAPLTLRERISDERARPSGAVRRRRLGAIGGIAAAACVAALVAVLVLSSGGGGPTVVEASALAELPATQPEVAVDPDDPRLLEESQSGVPFPNFDPAFDWRQAGARADELEGRDTTTVFYERGGERIGYTILSGDAIDPPQGSARTVQNEVELWSDRLDGREVVTWYRDGRTCVLSGEGVSASELRDLAAWNGEGAVRF
jgi:hypothetical protein